MTAVRTALVAAAVYGLLSLPSWAMAALGVWLVASVLFCLLLWPRIARGLRR